MRMLVLFVLVGGLFAQSDIVPAQRDKIQAAIKGSSLADKHIHIFASIGDALSKSYVSAIGNALVGDAGKAFPRVTLNGVVVDTKSEPRGIQIVGPKPLVDSLVKILVANGITVTGTNQVAMLLRDADIEIHVNGQ